MDFHQHIITKSGDLWVIDANANGFVKSDQESRQEYEARVLAEMLRSIDEKLELDHEPNGAPILTNSNGHISISHSESWFAIYLSNHQAVGVDLEVHTEQIEKTKTYFLSENEIEQLQPSTEQLHICWGIKESVFKMLRGNIHSLKEEIQITSIEENQAQAIFHQQYINLKFLQTHNFTLVYTN